MSSIALNKEDFCETHTAYRVALIHSTYSSNRQSELEVTHTNAPTALPASRTSFSDKITLWAVVLKLSNVTFAEFFTLTAKIEYW